jgi:hypothetical protein
MINIQALIDDAKCFQTVRATRRPDGVRCPGCGGAEVTKDGHDPERIRRRKIKRMICFSETVRLTHYWWILIFGTL